MKKSKEKYKKIPEDKNDDIPKSMGCSKRHTQRQVYINNTSLLQETRKPQIM